jgi:hypothetical protein
MRTATRRHLYHVRGLAKFAKVTVGQALQLTVENDLAEPQIILSGALEDVSEHQEVIVAARRGIHDTEVRLGWQGPPHCVVTIEGLLVDGIDPNAACIAAGLATRELIEK